MRIVHTVNSLRATHGGPSRSVTALADAMSRRGADVRLLTHDDVPEEQMVVPAAASVRRVPFRLTDEFRGRGRFERSIIEDGRPDVLHEHGLWLPLNRGSAKVAERYRIARVISIRGMLSGWALGQSRFRKKVAWHAFQAGSLRRAALLHVTAADELQDVRRMGLSLPVAVIPNGIDIPDLLPATPSGDRTLLFLSRLHRIKGVDELLQAWKAVQPDGWRLVIAGPVEDPLIGRRVRELSERDSSVEYVGEVDDVSKWDLYKSADLFVLPTHSENFGIVVAEALGAGVPVITTRAAPWSELESHTCGWWIDTGTEPLIVALRDATTRPKEALEAMGARGRELVRLNYSWDMIAERMLASYEWILGRGSKPSWLHA